jgi:hypothetical protein
MWRIAKIKAERPGFARVLHQAAPRSTAPSRLIEAFERPPQGRFARNAGSIMMLFAVKRSNIGIGYKAHSNYDRPTKHAASGQSRQIVE